MIAKYLPNIRYSFFSIYSSSHRFCISIIFISLSYQMIRVLLPAAKGYFDKHSMGKKGDKRSSSTIDSYKNLSWLQKMLSYLVMMMVWPLIIPEILPRVPGPAVLSLQKHTLFLNQDPQQTGEPYTRNANLEAGVLLD